MSYEWKSIIILLGILLLGYLIVFLRSMPIQKNKKLAVEFRENLSKYCESNGKDSFTFEWLVKNSIKMQNLCSLSGMTYTFRRALDNQVHNDYPIVANGILHIKDEFKVSWSSSRDDAMAYFDMVDNFLLAYVGICENDIVENNYNYNPFKTFSIGVRYILLSPIKLVHSFGIIGDKTYFKIIENGLVILITNLTALVGLVAEIYALIIGWDSFLAKLVAIF